MSIINNSGINYSIYYNVLNYFMTILNNHPSIGFVSQGDMWEIDTASFPKYPIANVMITNVRFEDSSTIYTINLLVGDKVKDKERASEGEYNKQNTDFYGDDDTVDIHANALAIINDITSFTQYSTTNFDIDGSVFCEAFKDRFDNGLAGYSATFDLVTHNNRDRCLFNLLDGSNLDNC